ncbi:hypothetical protein CLV58_13136 [Spirosoma oryzae]|uniref:Uncharacterized protein n=1 Tax=Spirosoma oryzae TaxID=1469603 RepID=A0A2T0S320_9BACT|nr:hypothetical protein [Spirosoma oryzae]PRY27818.1 hypothetical protein CLV58_13136 [Spirosoma oryzae]
MMVSIDNFRRGGLLIGLYLLTRCAWAQMPPVNTLYPSTSDPVGLEQQIDQLIQEQSGSIMNGLQGYGFNFGKAIEQKILDEVMSGIASAVVYAPIAEKILTAYQKQKNNSLAQQLGQVKNVAKAGLNNQLKIQYQDLKLAYEKAKYNAVESRMFNGSKTELFANKQTDGLYGNYVGVVDEFYKSQAQHDMLRQDDKYMGYYVIGTAATLAGTDDMKAKMAMAKRTYQPGSSSGEVTQTSAYDRIMLKQQIRDQALRQQAGLYSMQGLTRANILNKQRQLQRKRYSQTIKLPSQNL